MDSIPPGGKEMEEDRKRWDLKYRGRRFESSQRASAILKKYLRFFPKGKALDLAAGEGRNAVFLAEHGFDVQAVDISRTALVRAKKSALSRGVRIKTVAADLDTLVISKEEYDLILDFYFLERRLIPRIKRGLKKEGMVVFETYTTGQRERAAGGPSKTKYLLKPNELLRLFRGFQVLFYREGVFREGGKHRAIASLIARKQVKRKR
jgi:2-polyprenyl-3-methyl-5-hydroxy-6-metoxy-1,4-benzoquinol methylase